MKIITLLAPLMFFNLHVKAGFLRYLDELESCDAYEEVQYVKSLDSLSPGGGGSFVWVANDLRPGMWGWRMKSAQAGKAGTWVRQDVQALSPDWFGARHLKNTLSEETPTFRNLGYDEQTIRKRYFQYIPDISLDDTPDWAALQMTFLALGHGVFAAHLSPGDYYINRTLRLPELTRQTDNTIYLIEGNGCTLTSINKAGFCFLESMPVNQREGLNVFTARRFHISNLILRGKAEAGAGSVGIRIGATFHSLFENLHLANLDTGIVLRHAMSSEIYRCNAINCYRVCYYLGSGKGAWPGADAPNSGSNQSRVIASRMFAYPGQYAGVMISNSSECRVEDFTLDGGAKRNTAFVIHVNTGGTTTVKDAYVKGIHGEAAVDSALVKFRGSGNPLFEVCDLFVQMKCTVVELETTNGYAQVNCRNFSYLPPGSGFANKGNGGAWSFVDVFEKGKEPVWKSGGGYSVPVPGRLRIVKKLM
ncbi:MAG: hypothetical protein JNL88_06090 [Bacteroidia bacterium]|nr:hypothetical protein [Bacteroidia bacterium]